MGGPHEDFGQIRLAVTDTTVRRWIEQVSSRQGFAVVADRDAPIDPGSEVALVYEMTGASLGEALEGLRRAVEGFPGRTVLAVVGSTDSALAERAFDAGAYDLLFTPIVPVTLDGALRRARDRLQRRKDVQRLRAELDAREDEGAFAATSPAMQEIMRQVDRVIQSDITVALIGESGTGKEVVARAIHAGGRRASAPFVVINCAALPETLHEPELFGHERGAFRGAEGVHRGRFEQAQGGTLFLDEVGELSALTQASLLRALQEGSVRRMGGVEEIPVDVRLICSTQRDLEKEVKAGRFREDLFYRLVVYSIRLPLLRERREDIPLLVQQCLLKYAADVGRRIEAVAPDALRLLMDHAWPGNVRELENVVHRAMLSADGPTIGVQHLPPDFTSGDALTDAELGLSDAVLPMRELERRSIQRALRVTGGSVEKAAKLLGMGRATLYRRLAKYDSIGQGLRTNED